MAITVSKAAQGNSGNTAGPVKTPAPTRPALNDVVSQARKGGDKYGQNSGVNNPSRIDPGKQLLSPLAANLKASSDDGEGVLDTVIAKGTRMDSPDFQMRKIDPSPYPITPGHKNPNANPTTVPSKTGGK